ncbi:MAG: hypothetical protein KKA42_05560 [candidate division Zixibacteria bacterium]|nr:hypothetical protein [candidate division Zixibacteria bacterium]
MEIRKHSPAHAAGIAAFSLQPAAHGAAQLIDASSGSNWPPGESDGTLYQESFLAIEDTDSVQGGYTLRCRPFVLNGEPTIIGQLCRVGWTDRDDRPGALDNIIADAVNRRPLLFALGAGGPDQPLHRCLADHGWEVVRVPFYFRIVKARQFLRNVTYLRTNILKRIGLDLVAFSGLGSLALRYVHSDLKAANTRAGQMTVEVVDRFDSWADDLWHEAAPSFDLAGVRDLRTLPVLYPDHDQRFVRLLFSSEYRPVGWAVCVGTQLKEHSQFGNMRIGSIVDAVVKPPHVSAALAAAAKFLAKLDIDLVISSQTHQDYCIALEQNALRSGPSNLTLAISPELVKALDPFDIKVALSLFSRGDGDDPFRL